MTCPLNKNLLRLAVAISTHLAGSGHRPPLAGLPSETWERAQRLARQIRRAEGRGWQLAAAELRDDLRYAILSLQSELSALADALDRSPRHTPETKLHDLYQDLVALDEQFAGVDFDRRARSLAVTTEPIELEGLLLGPFTIRLDWGRLTSETCYRVIADEPNPASSREEVTHPHVLAEVLCEGDGRSAIRQALAQGRLLDFFTLVAGVLRTYNDESPFVAIDVWQGRPCADCGYLESDEELYCLHSLRRTALRRMPRQLRRLRRDFLHGLPRAVRRLPRGILPGLFDVLPRLPCPALPRLPR